MRPAGWRGTLALLVLLAYAPAALFGVPAATQWLTMQWFVIASGAMLLPRRAGIATALATALGWSMWAVGTQPEATSGTMALGIGYVTLVLLGGGGGLYGAARLVRLGTDIRDAQAGLAELAVERERLRISRDLHDLLGQSLAAVSLKGDLAIGLLARDEVPRAAAELDGLVSVARSALHDLRALPHGAPPIALASEAARAADLLAAAGIETRVAIDDAALPPPVDALFGWALREGVTNVLRHSTATRCTIAVRRAAGTFRLDIANDRAVPNATGGLGGLDGLAARAAALAGTARGRATREGGFRLTVEVSAAPHATGPHGTMP